MTFDMLNISSGFKIAMIYAAVSFVLAVISILLVAWKANDDINKTYEWD